MEAKYFSETWDFLRTAVRYKEYFLQYNDAVWFLVRRDISEEYIASFFRLKESESPWFAARMYLTADGEENLSHSCPLREGDHHI
jgi:hypothetical protein